MTVATGHVSYRIQDSEKEIVSIPVFFTSSSGLLADIMSFATALDPVIDAVLDSQLLSSDIVVNRALAGGLKSSPTAGGRNEHGLVASYNVTGTAKHYGLDLPSFIPAGILDKKADPANTPWVDFLAFSLATTNTCQFQNDHQQTIASAYRNFENFRKYRRALVRAR